MRFGQLVLGPAGSGKSTYCSAVVKHCEALRRKAHVINLDPAAEHFEYEPIIDIREIIQAADPMEDEDLHLGPNGALIYCMEEFMNNLDWLQERLEEGDEEYILFDIPGQIELFTHFDIIARLVRFLKENLDFRLCGVFLLDAQFVTDLGKFFSGSFASLATMINLEVSFVSLLSKTDLLSEAQRNDLDNFFDLGPELLQGDDFLNSEWAAKYRQLTMAIASVLDEYSLVKFLPFNINEEELISDALVVIDDVLQWAEEQDVKINDFDPPENAND
ncbi:GPN-loop GTPase 3 [Tetranychus urticae]|uniref:GPN-loop GTPase 3 n=1 Tax=Tetranychus urticae TaxID=32264 RepID=T1KN24_TETUR|nr:GPN-loop GTPase 3 [Tetranychus urticae]